ncbi:MAG: sulfurtransferase [Cyclobacteriaceae bacterium]
MSTDSPIVSADWLKDNLHNPNLILLDASLAKPKTSPEENPLNGLQIPGSQFFDINGQFSDTTIDLPHMMCDAVQFTNAAQKLGINSDSQIVVYDNLGVYSSPRAWWMFRSMGHKRIKVLDGGLPEWAGAGNPTEPITELSFPPGNFTAQPLSGYFRDADYVLNAIENAKVLILDARSKGRFFGTEPEPRQGLRGGHIPNSESLPFPDVLAGTKMKSISELEELFSEFDIGEKELVFSCGSGLTACIILLAATRIGHDQSAVYDGSWSEWGQPSERPVIR